MKSYTDLEQSKKLAEILPLESANMHYMHTHIDIIRLGKPYKETDVPAWSLAALLSVLPKGTNISTPKPVNELGYCCWNQYDEIYASNPIDACYEMVIKLHKLKML